MSDTSTLVYLAAIEQARLLPKLYGRVLIPPAVRAEILAGVSSMDYNAKLLEADWLETHALMDASKARALAVLVDDGEAEAITLALETKADLLLIDDAEGREVARREGLHVIGLLGILIDAKKKGLLTTVTPILTRLESDTTFRMSAALRQHIIKEAGESVP